MGRNTIPLRPLLLRQRAGRSGEENEGGISECALRRRPPRHHHRDRTRTRILLRGGLPSAVPGQKSARLLWPRRHRRSMPHRHQGLIHPSIHPSIHPVHLSRPSIHPSRPSRPSIPSIHPVHISRPSIPSIHPVHPSIHLSIHPSIRAIHPPPNQLVACLN